MTQSEIINKLLSIKHFFYVLEPCIMIRDLPPDTVVWKEIDQKPGFTAGDQPVNPGDILQPNDIVKIGECVEW